MQGGHNNIATRTKHNGTACDYDIAISSQVDKIIEKSI